MEFEQEHLNLISQYESSAVEIEKIMFTKRYKISRKHYSLLSVQSLSILYSYWEGFIQNSFQLYIDFLNEQNLDFRDLNENIVIYHMENTFKQFREYPQKNKQKISFFTKLDDHFLQKKHRIYRIVDTESNVNFSVLNRLLSQFSLQKFPEYWEKYKYPNPNLKDSLNAFVRYRNGVAHGGDISSEEKISQKVYEWYRLLICDLMYAIHEKFLDAIDQKTYLKREEKNE